MLFVITRVLLIFMMGQIFAVILVTMMIMRMASLVCSYADALMLCSPKRPGWPNESS